MTVGERSTRIPIMAVGKQRHEQFVRTISPSSVHPMFQANLQ